MLFKLPKAYIDSKEICLVLKSYKLERNCCMEDVAMVADDGVPVALNSDGRVGETRRLPTRARAVPEHHSRGNTI